MGFCLLYAFGVVLLSSSDPPVGGIEDMDL